MHEDTNEYVPIQIINQETNMDENMEGEMKQ